MSRVLVVFAFFLIPGLSGCDSPEGDVGFVPTPFPAVQAMLELAGVGPEDVVYDLGSGDGRIPIMAANRFGARGVGVELREFLVQESREAVQEAGLSDQVTILHQNLFSTDLREATVVTLYLLPELNLQLRPKLLEELAPGSRIVSHAFDMGEWEPDQTVTVGTSSSTLHLWIVPARVGGLWQWTVEADGSLPAAQLRLRQEFQKLITQLTVNGENFHTSRAELTGTRISLKAEGNLNGTAVRMEMDGQIEGERIDGRLTLSGPFGSRQRAWSARKTTPPSGRVYGYTAGRTSIEPGAGRPTSRKASAGKNANVQQKKW